jgi:hypothetical protein
LGGRIFFFFLGSPERQKWPLGVAGSLSPYLLGWIVAKSISFFFSFFVIGRKDKNGHWGWPDLSPLAVGVDCGHSQWPDLLLFFSFSFFGFAGKVARDGGGWRHLGTECFDFILNLCIFLKRLMCQLMSVGQKNPTFMP